MTHDHDDDGELSDRLRQLMSELVRRADQATVAAMEIQFDRHPAGHHFTMPGEFHPFYAEYRDFIVGWLDDPEHPYAGRNYLLIPRTPRSAFAVNPGQALHASASFTSLFLQRHRVFALAPFVGDPYVYAWWLGKDDLGRTVAGRAERCWMDRGDHA